MTNDFSFERRQNTGNYFDSSLLYANEDNPDFSRYVKNSKFYNKENIKVIIKIKMKLKMFQLPNLFD